MAQHDITITQQQYDRLVADFAAVNAKLESLIPVFERVIATEGGKQKLRQLIRDNPDAAWIRLWVQTTRKWGDWLEEIMEAAE